MEYDIIEHIKERKLKTKLTFALDKNFNNILKKLDKNVKNIQKYKLFVTVLYSTI
jgi:hypothetical protein